MGTGIRREDLASIAGAEFIPWDKLRNKTIFLTGGTGLIGTSIIHSLHFANQEKGLGITLSALVRDRKKAEKRFGDILDDGMLTLVEGAVEELPEIGRDIDYIIHGAGQTASKEFVKHPVETINTALLGTMNTLALAKAKQVEGYVYLSSMEVYGYPEKGHKVTEDEIGMLSPLNIRNSYPGSKISCEALVCAYASEYALPAMICRLAQTFGPGVHYNDTRVFAYFGRCAKEHRDIVLKTKGETKRSYLYTADAAAAIFTILLKGQGGHAYNAADETTYCSIAEMAEEIARSAGVKVVYDVQDEKANGFLQTLYMDLDTTALKNLGWRPLDGGTPVPEMFERMICFLK